MTQAHKTPGALVELIPEQISPEELSVFGPWMGRVLEVVSVYPRGHIVVRDFETKQGLGGKPIPGQPEYGFHEERFRTVSPSVKRKLSR